MERGERLIMSVKSEASLAVSSDTAQIRVPSELLNQNIEVRLEFSFRCDVTDVIMLILKAY